MAYFQNYNRYGNEMHTSTSNTGSLSIRPSLSPSFSLPGLTTPNLGIRPETIILVGGGILLLAYLSKRNEGLSALGTSTTGAITGVADAVGNTAGFVGDIAGVGRDAVSFARSSASDAFRFGSSVGSSSGFGGMVFTPAKAVDSVRTAASVVSNAAFTPAKAVDSVRTAASVVSNAAFTPAKAVDSVRTAASVVSNAAFTPAKAVDSVRTAASVVSNAAQVAVRTVNDASASLFRKLERY